MDSGYIKSQRKPKPKPKNKGGRPVGSLDKLTIYKRITAQRELLEAANFKIATEHMDTQIGWLEGLVATLNPFGQDGHVIKGKSTKLYFRAFELYRDFLALRAPYQSPRLSAVQLMPQQSKRTTTVNVTILNERGEKEYSDAPDEDQKLIEHNANDEAAA